MHPEPKEQDRKMRQKLLLLAAVFFGVLAFMFTYHQINLERQRIQGSVMDTLVIQAIKDLSEGDRITDENIRVVKVKRSANSVSMTREIPGDRRDTIIDRQVQFHIGVGQTLEWTDLKASMNSGRSGLSSMIPPGLRAIAIAVDATGSVNGLIQPNNHVDIIGTFKFPDMKGDTAYDTITMTILQNVAILATGGDMGMQDDAKGRGRNYSTVTLALSPKEVEMIIFASQKGRIQLSLRNYEELKIEQKVQSVNWKYLQENIQNYTLEREQTMKLRSRGGK